MGGNFDSSESASGVMRGGMIQRLEFGVFDVMFSLTEYNGSIYRVEGCCIIDSNKRSINEAAGLG